MGTLAGPPCARARVATLLLLLLIPAAISAKKRYLYDEFIPEHERDQEDENSFPEVYENLHDWSEGGFVRLLMPAGIDVDNRDMGPCELGPGVEDNLLVLSHEQHKHILHTHVHSSYRPLPHMEMKFKQDGSPIREEDFNEEEGFEPMDAPPPGMEDTNRASDSTGSAATALDKDLEASMKRRTGSGLASVKDFTLSAQHGSKVLPGVVLNNQEFDRTDTMGIPGWMRVRNALVEELKNKQGFVMKKNTILVSKSGICEIIHLNRNAQEGYYDLQCQYLQVTDIVKEAEWHGKAKKIPLETMTLTNGAVVDLAAPYGSENDPTFDPVDHVQDYMDRTEGGAGDWYTHFRDPATFHIPDHHEDIGDRFEDTALTETQSRMGTRFIGKVVSGVTKVATKVAKTAVKAAKSVANALTNINFGNSKLMFKVGKDLAPFTLLDMMVPATTDPEAIAMHSTGIEEAPSTDVHIKLQLKDAYFAFEPVLEFRGKIEMFKPKNLKFVIGGKVKVKLNALTTLTGRLDFSDIKELLNMNVGNIFFVIGVVPVYIMFTLVVEAGVVVKVIGVVEVESGVALQLGVEAGAEMKNGKFKGIFKPLFDMEVLGPTLKMCVDANAEVYLKPGILMALYGVVGPKLELEPYLNFDFKGDGSKNCGAGARGGWMPPGLTPFEEEEWHELSPEEQQELEAEWQEEEGGGPEEEGSEGAGHAGPEEGAPALDEKDSGKMITVDGGTAAEDQVIRHSMEPHTGQFFNFNTNSWTPMTRKTNKVIAMDAHEMYLRKTGTALPPRRLISRMEKFLTLSKGRKQAGKESEAGVGRGSLKRLPVAAAHEKKAAPFSLSSSAPTSAAHHSTGSTSPTVVTGRAVVPRQHVVKRKPRASLHGYATHDTMEPFRSSQMPGRVPSSTPRLEEGSSHHEKIEKPRESAREHGGIGQAEDQQAEGEDSIVDPLSLISSILDGQGDDAPATGTQRHRHLKMHRRNSHASRLLPYTNGDEKAGPVAMTMNEHRRNPRAYVAPTTDVPVPDATVHAMSLPAEIDPADEADYTSSREAGETDASLSSSFLQTSSAVTATSQTTHFTEGEWMEAEELCEEGECQYLEEMEEFAAEEEGEGDGASIESFWVLTLGVRGYFNIEMTLLGQITIAKFGFKLFEVSHPLADGCVSAGCNERLAAKQEEVIEEDEMMEEEEMMMEGG